MRGVVLGFLASVGMAGGIAASTGENLEMWYDASGKAVAILPEEKRPAEFISTWERQAEGRKQRAESRQSSVRRPSRERSYAEWSGYDYGYFSSPYYRYFQPRSYPVYSSPCRWNAGYHGSYRGGGLRVNIRIH